MAVLTTVERLMAFQTAKQYLVRTGNVFTSTYTTLVTTYNSSSTAGNLVAISEYLAGVDTSALTVTEKKILAELIATIGSELSFQAGAISSYNLAAGAVGSGNLAAGAVGSGNLAAGAVGSGNLAAGAVNFDNLAQTVLDSLFFNVDPIQTTGSFRGCSGTTPFSTSVVMPVPATPASILLTFTICAAFSAGIEPGVWDGNACQAISSPGDALAKCVGAVMFY